MGATTKTPNYGLPLFLPGDKPSWLSDVNEAFKSCDTVFNPCNPAPHDIPYHYPFKERFLTPKEDVIDFSCVRAYDLGFATLLTGSIIIRGLVGKTELAVATSVNNLAHTLITLQRARKTMLYGIWGNNSRLSAVPITVRMRNTATRTIIDLLRQDDGLTTSPRYGLIPLNLLF